MPRLLPALLITVLAVGGASASAAHAAALTFAPPVHADTRGDVGGGPLDLRSVRFGQAGTAMVLEVRTAAPWSPGALRSTGARTLCLTVAVATAPATVRLCVAGRGGRPVLRAAPVRPDGSAGPTVAVPGARLQRPDARTLTATFTPLAAGLPRGTARWSLASAWTDRRACAAGCADRAPERGTYSTRIGLLGLPRCFGAAARDPWRRCANPALRTAVVPTPREARMTPNAACTRLPHEALIHPCAFGVPGSLALETVALVGDSHAMHWRGGLEVVAQALRWRGLSITRSSCAFTTETPILLSGIMARHCTAWNGQVGRWLARHPEIHTILVAADVPQRGRYGTAGFQAAWRRLPASVRRIIVLRDTPRADTFEAACVRHALARDRSPGPFCARPRRLTLPADPQVAAARALGSSRVRVIDMSRYMCSTTRCFPVVGGALVRKDGSHLTRLFSATMGPYLLRAITRLDPPR